MRCSECGNDVPQRIGSRGRPRKYCSSACQIKSNNRTMLERRRAITAKAREGRTCRQCGEPIPDSRDMRARTCSVKCDERWQNRVGNQLIATERRRRRETRPPCAQCGGPVPVDLTLRARYCSPQCSKKGWGAVHAADYNRRYNYGITPEEYTELFEKQEARCAICRSPDWPGKDNAPHVDHDHVTGKIRGLLCHPCNLGLGQFKDDPALLRAALAYLAA